VGVGKAYLKDNFTKFMMVKMPLERRSGEGRKKVTSGIAVGDKSDPSSMLVCR
jgi:hypothetical protein